MKKKRFLVGSFFLFFVSIVNIKAQNLSDIIAEDIVKSSFKYNHDTKTLFSLIETESNFSPYSLSVVVSKEKAEKITFELKLNEIKHSCFDYNGRKIISITPESKKKAVLALSIIKKSGSKKYDLGIAQINKAKIIDNRWNEYKILLDVGYCIDKCAYILRGCMKKHNDTKKAIECYNKGENANYTEFDYFKKVAKNYKKAIF